MTGQASMRVTSRPGPEIFGGVVDVGAGGARIRVRPGQGLAAGDSVHVDLELPLPATPVGVAPVRLAGFGSVVRVDRDDDVGTVAAIRFDGPLAVADAYPLPARPVRPTATVA